MHLSNILLRKNFINFLHMIIHIICIKYEKALFDYIVYIFGLMLQFLNCYATFYSDIGKVTIDF